MLVNANCLSTETQCEPRAQCTEKGQKKLEFSAQLHGSPQPHSRPSLGSSGLIPARHGAPVATGKAQLNLEESRSGDFPLCPHEVSGTEATKQGDRAGSGGDASLGTGEESRQLESICVLCRLLTGFQPFLFGVIVLISLPPSACIPGSKQCWNALGTRHP